MISSLEDPASRFRIMQYYSELTKQGIYLDYPVFRPLRDANPNPAVQHFQRFTKVSAWRTWNLIKTWKRLPLIWKQFEYDLVWQNRLILPHHDFLETIIRKPLVFDFDDAVWLTEGEHAIRKVIKKAAHVFAGNAFLEAYAKKSGKHVSLIPSTIDTEKLYPLANNDSAFFTIGWIGSVSNFHNLESVREPLLDFLRLNKKARFLAIAPEVPPNFPFDGTQVCFQQWIPDGELEQINQFSVGIMPLIDNLWNRGKCSYKMLQAMACGKPVIVTPLGLNYDILAMREVGFGAVSHQEWKQAFKQLMEDQDLYEAFSKNARSVVKEHFDSSMWASKIAAIFRNCI